jgi:DNA-binding response OmpR family regulator
MKIAQTLQLPTKPIDNLMEPQCRIMATGVNKLLASVLVIDDDSAMTDLLKLMLKQESFDVITTNSGREGIAAARQKNPNVIILDLLMPGEDGWQICETIREFSQVPILVLSALNSPGLLTKALDAGADDVLIKPVSMGMLIAHLNKLTRRARAEMDAVSSRGITPSSL